MVDLRELLEGVVRERQYDDENSATPGEMADAILATLDAAGLVVVPREPTEEMEDAWMENGHQQTASGDYSAMLAASPYAKKEVE